MTAEALILAGDTLLTMDAANTVLPGGAVLVEDGRIATVGALADLKAAQPGVPV
jgi:5-methylthioadenosine/S-adenosylhomocysteine deaminase